MPPLLRNHPASAWARICTAVLAAAALSGPIACACHSEREVAARTTVVSLTQDPKLPAMKLTVPEFLGAPTSLGRSPSPDPEMGYLLVGMEDLEDLGDGFAATVRIAHASELEPACLGQWTSEQHGERRVETCTIGHVKAVHIPHAGGEILCWSDWHAFGEPTPARRGIARAIDASCMTLAFE